MASNQKPKLVIEQLAAEPFKRAVAGCLRAIAKKQGVDVSFAAERPGLAGLKARLPEPARKLTQAGSRHRARACRRHGAAARLP